MEEIIQNKVAESGIMTLNLENFLATNYVVLDIQPFLFMGLILKEKDFRKSLQEHDWTLYQDKNVIISCSADAIIPVWAYMLLSSYLQGIATHIVQGTEEEGKTKLLLHQINSMQVDEYEDKRVVIKGCGEIPIPDEVYTAVTFKLKPVVKSLMYGEPCSTVPIYKKKKI
ncbi:MAG: DUF2480 family protein [Chitinophagaceae bacterium]